MSSVAWCLHAALTNDAPQALAQALLPYAVAQGQQPEHVSPASMLVNSSGCSTAPSQSPAPRMPTAATLMAEGRADLVQRVKQAGGFTKVMHTLFAGHGPHLLETGQMTALTDRS